MSTRTDSRSPSTTLFRSLRPFLRQVSQAHRRAEQRGTADQANGQVTIAIGLVGSDLLAQLADISRQLGIFRAALLLQPRFQCCFLSALYRDRVGATQDRKSVV